MNILTRLLGHKEDLPEASAAASIASAFAACEAGQYDKARKAYQSIVEKSPKLSMAWYNLGVTEFRSGN
jgi:tetratricopeptide (TPR) repeat protein